jgi:hypothetical protein
MLHSLTAWGREKSNAKNDYNLFVKEIGGAGFQRKYFPMHLCGNFTALGSYLGKKSLGFGEGGYIFDGYGCSGVLGPVEWEEHLVDHFERYLRDFPDRAFVRMNDDYREIDPDLGKFPINHLAGYLAISMTNPDNISSWVDRDHIKAGDLLTENNLIPTLNQWIDTAILAATKDRKCEIPLAYQHLIKVFPRLFNEMSMDSLGNVVGSLQFKEQWEPGLYARRAKLVLAMDSPHHYDEVKQSYDRLSGSNSDDVKAIASDLLTYLKKMDAKAPYLYSGIKAVTSGGFFPSDEGG